MSSSQSSTLLDNVVYEAVKYLMKAIQSTFFMEVALVGEERIPRYGPVIFVGNHSNQFVDGVLLVTNMPRVLYFLVAAKSLRRPIIGWLAKACKAIPVERPQDIAFVGSGNITVTLQNPNTLVGTNTQFKAHLSPGTKITTADKKNTYTIEKVISDTQALLKDPITLKDQITKYSPDYKVFPKVDQHHVFNSATNHLCSNGSIAVFPEGGSHDRTQLLPLKPGVAIMALSAMNAGAEDVTIVPIGLNYFRRNVFRSQAILTIGTPFEVDPEMAKRYAGGDHRGAVGELLGIIQKEMERTILPAQDYKEQMVIKLCASLVPPDRVRLPSEKRFFLSQKFAMIFEKLRHTQMLTELREELDDYTDLLRGYGVRDWEVWRLQVGLLRAMEGMLAGVCKLIIMLLVAVPVTPLWLPMWIVCVYLAERHRQKALRESSVKIKGTDVLTSYQVIVGLVLVPLMNILYGLVFSILYCWRYGVGWFLFGWLVMGGCVFPLLEYHSLKILEKTPDVLQSIKVFAGAVMSNVNLWRNAERDVMNSRIRMQLKVREIVRLIADAKEEKEEENKGMGDSQSESPLRLGLRLRRGGRRGSTGFQQLMGIVDDVDENEVIAGSSCMRVVSWENLRAAKEAAEEVYTLFPRVNLEKEDKRIARKLDESESETGGETHRHLRRSFDVEIL